MTKHFGELKILVNSFNPMIISGLVLTLPIAYVVLVLLLFSELCQLSKSYLGEGQSPWWEGILSSSLYLAFIACTIPQKIAHLHWLFSPAKLTIFSIYHGHQPFYF